MKTNRNVGLFLCALACAALAAASSRAGEISETIFAIEAQSSVGTAVFDVPITSGNIDGDTLTWTLDQAIPLMDDNNNEIALLEMANVTYVADPIVVLNFLVTSGGAAANFVVTSANLGFAGIPNAVARASAALTVTDFGGDGATLTGNFPNNDSYRAYYNDPGNVPATGTAFATLTPGVATPTPFASATSMEEFPVGGGFSATDENAGVLGLVSSMSSRWSFGVSQFDSASGTSVYVVVPEPGSVLLCILGTALLALVRRR